MRDQKLLDKKEIVRRILEVVELVKKSGSTDANIGCSSRARAITKLSALSRELGA